MGWMARFHALVLLVVLIDLALVGNAERPEREKNHKVAKLQPWAPDPKVVENDSSADDSSDVESDVGESSDDDVESDVEVDDASEPCLEAEQQECEDWGKSGYGCIWRQAGEGWCYHKKSTRYKDQRPNLKAIYAEDGIQDAIHAHHKGKADNLRETPNAKGGHARPLDDGGEYELDDSSANVSGGGPLAAANKQFQEGPEWKPDADIQHPHYQHTREVGIQVGKLVSDAANQVKGGLHPKADEAKYRSDIYHNTLHDFDHDLRAYKQGVANFRRTAAIEHKVKTKNLRDELVKSPELMQEHHPGVQDFNDHLDRHVVK